MKAAAYDRFWAQVTVLAVFAGLFYSSWPLGYLLNPAASRAGLASELEAVHQPYNWLFSLCDVISGLLVMTLAWLLWRRFRDNEQQNSIAIALSSIVVFGAGTILDTLLPMKCTPSLQRCPSFRQDHILLLHGLFSITAGIALFVSLALLWWQDYRNVLLSSVLTGYIVFGLISLEEIIKPKPSNWSQHYYLALCSIWLMVLPSALYKLFVVKQWPRQS